MEFRKWANKVLKQYIIQGYAINEKRLEALQRTVSIQTKMLASTLEVEEIDVLKAVNLYTEALTSNFGLPNESQMICRICSFATAIKNTPFDKNCHI